MVRPARFATPSRRNAARLLTGCALGLVLAALPRAAQAQAFQGGSSVVVGTANVTTPTPGVTNIGVTSSEVVINWTPTDTSGTGTIDFLPTGTTATFRGAADFTVLNRILPDDGNGLPVDRAVAFNGTVLSQIGLRAPVQGGNVWFYSPTGIVVGNGAQFTVGGLILTTDDIVYGKALTGGTELFGPSNNIMFRGPAGVKSLVDVQALSNIDASSYVALVAPRVQQGGTVSADGPIGYVAAEQADIAINAGLFDISISTGTTDANGIVHTGTTTGPASTAATDQQQIMMVAMPKATALAMLLSGSIGYTPAASAADDGSSVILSAGYAKPTPDAEVPTSLGAITLDSVNFSNPLSAYSTGSLDISGPATFQSNAYLFAQDAISVDLGAGESVTGLLALSLASGRAGKGGDIKLTLGGKASLTAGDYLDIRASSEAEPFFVATPPIDGKGGTITVDVNGGAISAPSIYADVSGYGNYDPVAGGIGMGGTISFSATSGGQIIAPGGLSMTADGGGGPSDVTGGAATAGSVSLTSDNSALNVGSVFIEAEGFAGDGGVLSGAATGGKAAISLSGGTYNWSSLDVETDAFSSIDYASGGQGNAATARADAVTLSLDNAAHLTVGDILLTAEAFATINAPAGATAQGGTIQTTVSADSSLDFDTFTADAEAGINLPVTFIVTADTTPDVFGGTVNFHSAGQVSGAQMSLVADGNGQSASSTAGSVHGGTVDMLVTGGKVDIDNDGPTTLRLSAIAGGAVGHVPADAAGGSATLTVDGGILDVNGLIDVSADAIANNPAWFVTAGPDPFNGFSATGGTAQVQLSGAAGTLTTGTLAVHANADTSTPEFFFSGGEVIPPGTYGGPLPANYGTATGGTASLAVSDGTLGITDVTVQANGTGGTADANPGGPPFRSGDGRGGTASMTVSGGVSTITDLTVAAGGFGGGGIVAGGGDRASFAGDGYGGNASLTSSGGTLGANTLTIDANGIGGAGGGDDSGNPGTDGGNGTGGAARLVSTPGGSGQLTLPTLQVTATGTGGEGGFSTGISGNGGKGIGGTAATALADGAFSLGPLTLDGRGIGGEGAPDGIGVLGGEGTGGAAQFVLVDTTGPTGARTIGPLTLLGSGVGGAGSGGVAQSDAGTTKLDVEVANSASALTIDGDFRAVAQGTRAAAGDGFTAKTAGGVFTVDGNTTIDTPRDVTMTVPVDFISLGDVTSNSRFFTQTGRLDATGGMSITAPQGISADFLRSDNTGVQLLAVNGAINVANLTSFAGVTALGRSIDIADGGRLIITSAQATAGDLSITPFGNLLVQSASATGSVTLNSTASNGTVSTTGDVTAGGNFNSSGRAGVSFGNIFSGGTTSLTSGNGPITVTNLSSAGLVTAAGNSIDISSSGALAFTSADAAAGNLHLATLGNLSLANGSATGSVTLSSSGGSIFSSGLVSSGTTFSASAPGGLSFNSLSSGDTTTLNSSDSIAVSDLLSVGNVTASGSAINIGSSGALFFDQATATIGDLSISTQGGLGLGGESAAGNLTLSSAAGMFTTTVPISAGGNVAISGQTGLTAATIVSGGTTSLTSGGGAVLVNDLTSPGLVTASGRSVDIFSSGTLAFTSANATAGNLHLATAGNLVLPNASASGSVTLSSGGGSITSSGLISSGSTFSATAAGALNFASLSSGGTTSLTTSGGPVTVTDLLPTGHVTAFGTSIAIGSSGGLFFDQANATAGNLSLTTALGLSGSGALSATGNVALTGAGGISSAGTVVSGGTTQLSAANGAISVASLTSPGAVTALGQAIAITSPGALTFSAATATNGALSLVAANLNATGPLSATGDVTLNGANGLTLGSVTSGGTTDLRADNGGIFASDLRSAGLVTARGRSIDLTSGAGLSFYSATATAGNLAITTAGDLSLADGSATGSVTLSSSGGSISSSGLVSSGGAFSANGASGLDFASISSGGTTSLQAPNGAVVVSTDLQSAGLVTAIGRSIDITSLDTLQFDTLTATNGDLRVSTRGDLTLDTTSVSGAIDLTSTNAAVSATGPISSGGAFSASGRDGVTFGSLTSGGTTLLTSSAGSVGVGNLSSAGLVTATGRTVDIAGTGPLSFANATATAGDLNVTTGGNLSFGGASATGAIDLSSTSGTVSATGPVTSGGAFSANGRDGLAFGALSSGGTTGLASSNGPITVTSLSSAGPVSAVGRTVTLNGSGSLTFANARATAGNLTVTAPGSLSFAQASASGAIGLSSSAGSLTATGPVTAGGAANLSGATGLTLASLASGGTTLINGGTGALNVSSLTSAGAVTALGRSISITSPGALAFTSIAATGGPAQVSTAGDLAIADGTVAGALTLASANGAVGSTGTVTAGGAVSLNGKAGLDFNVLNSGGATSLVSASGPIHVANLASAGLVNASGASIDIGSTGGLSFGDLGSPGTVAITTVGDLNLASVNAGSNLTLDSTGGGIAITGNVLGGFTQLSAHDDVTVGGTLTVLGDLGVDARGALLVVGDASSDDANVVADGGIAMGTFRTGEITRLTATNGNILVGDLQAGGRISAVGLDVDISSSGNLTFKEARATQNNLRIFASGNLGAETLFANHAMNLRAGGTFGLSGEARGENIAVTSRDIDIGGEAQLGIRGTTQSILLRNQDDERVTHLGGDGGSGGYDLDAAEAARLFADKSITLEAGSLIVIGDLQLSFGAEGNIGTGGLLEVTSPTNVEVSGNVDLVTSSADDTFTIDPSRIDVFAGEGSIALHGTGETPQGTINLTADTVAVVSRPTLDQLAGQNDLSQISHLLDTPAPAGPGDAYLLAGTINVDAKDAFFVQNGGASVAFPARRGFTADALNITTGSAATQIAINGLILQGGTPFAGVATAPLVRINGVASAPGGLFDPKSTINGCLVGAPCGNSPPPGDDLQPKVTPDNPGGDQSGTLIQLGDNQPLIAPPLVDEPITGVGNDDLWLPQCDPQKEGCPQQDTNK